MQSEHGEVTDPIVRPTALFKYLAPERLDALDGWLRCSTAVVLNDIFEMTTNFTAWSTPEELRALVAAKWPQALDRAVTDAFTRIEQLTGIPRAQVLALPGAEEGLRKLLEEWSDVTAPVGAMLDANLPKLNEVASSTFNTSVGVVSFTEESKSLLMWAHYADKHRGFVIEFAPDHPWFDRRIRPDDEFCWLCRVRYQRERAALVATQTSGEDVYLTKSADWEYEKEWRVLVPVQECEIRGQDAHHGVPVHAVRLPRDAIKRVILGSRMTAETRRAVVEAAKGLPICEAVPLKDVFGLDVQPLHEGK
jgi:hypothetical protein